MNTPGQDWRPPQWLEGARACMLADYGRPPKTWGRASWVARRGRWPRAPALRLDGTPFLAAFSPQFLMTTNSLSTCCESGGRTLADSGPAASAQAPVYCPVYESRLLATARHELNSAAALGVYGGPYGGSQSYGNYVTYGSEASAFYSLVREGGVYL